MDFRDVLRGWAPSHRPQARSGSAITSRKGNELEASRPPFHWYRARRRWGGSTARIGGSRSLAAGGRGARGTTHRTPPHARRGPFGASRFRGVGAGAVAARTGHRGAAASVGGQSELPAVPGRRRRFDTHPESRSPRPGARPSALRSARATGHDRRSAPAGGDRRSRYLLPRPRSPDYFVEASASKPRMRRATKRSEGPTFESTDCRTDT